MSRLEVFLDETPGETRGVVVRDGRFEHLLIQRDDEPAAWRRGARSVGRVARVEPGLKAAFVDLGEGPQGFLALGGGLKPAEGEALEVLTVAGPREDKGPALRWVGPSSGAPRLLEAGPDISARLAALAPGARPATGAPAIQAALDAGEEALESGLIVRDVGLDLKIERTRALVAVDLDWAQAGGGRQARDRANARGLAEAARMIRLKGWGGLVAIDLIGTGHDGKAIEAAARRAFGGMDDLALGPVNRFGVLMLSLPWLSRPVEDLIDGGDRAGALDAVRRLRLALLQETGSARMVLRCGPTVADIAAPWVEALGPRAALSAETALEGLSPIVESA